MTENIKEGNDRFLIETQRNVVNNERVNGTVFNLIIDCILENFNDSIYSAKRLDVIKYVGDGIDLTKEEQKVMHIIDNGTPRNYLESVVDWIVTDIQMPICKYGDDIAEQFSTDKNGTWFLSSEVNKTKAEFEFKINSLKNNKKKIASLRQECYLDVRNKFKSLSQEHKDIFKCFNVKNGGKSFQSVVDLMIEKRIDSNEALNLFIDSISN